MSKFAGNAPDADRVPRTALKELSMRLWKDESGQALVMTAFFMTMLLAFMALALDTGTLFRARRMVQTAADAAAMAAALDYKYVQNVGHAQNEAYTATAANGYTNGSNGVTVTVTPLMGTGIYTTCADCFEARVTVPNPTTFMGMFGIGSVNVTARAVAGIHRSEPCMLLDGAGTDLTNGGAETLNLTNCSFVDDGGLVNGGALTMHATLQGTLGVVGSVVNGGAMTTNPTIQSGIKPVQFPVALPIPSAAGCGPAITSSGTYSQGCYAGITVGGAAVINFNPGVYRFTGPITIGGAASLSGTGVSFVLDNGFTVGGGTTVNLSAPTSAGTWNGILFYENPSDTTNFVIGGAFTGNLTGIIYLPNAAFVVGGLFDQNLTAVVVAQQLVNGGGFTLGLNDYLLANPLSPLAPVTLME
jgi:Flp pilus assembly protein TadG